MENKFEQLLRKTLSKEESLQLLKDIENDPILKKEFEEYRDAWELVKTMERRNLKEKVSKIAEHQLTPKARSKGWIWYSAASVLVFVLCYWAFQQNTSGENLAQAYFKPYPDKFTTMGQNVNPLSKAMAAYKTGNYQEAEILLNQVPEEFSNDVKLYKGICWYQMNEKKKAKEVFKELSQDSSSTYKGPALWYLSLTHLALNEKDSANIVLQKIKNDSIISFHKEDAIEILDQLQ